MPIEMNLLSIPKETIRMKKSTISIFSRLRLIVHRSLAKGGLYQFLVFVILSLLVCGLVALGFCQVNLASLSQQTYIPDNRLSAAFFHLFTSGGQNQLGVPLGWLVTIAGAVLVAILTSLFTNFFDRTAQRYVEGLTHYSLKQHVAVFGYHEMLPGLLQQLFDKGYGQCYFLIQTSRVTKAYAELARALTPAQMRRVILQNGNIASAIDLPMMRVADAMEIFIVGEDMKLGADSSHDTHALQCLENIVDSLPVTGNDSEKKLCHVMFEHHSTFSVFQHTDLNREVFEKLAFLPFNYYEMWARKVFINDSLEPAVTLKSPYLPLEGTSGIGEESEDHVHLIVVGMSRMGIALGVEAAHLAHYPNFLNHPDRKTRITFIDRNARNEMYHFQGRMEAMFQIAPWRFVEPEEEEYGYCAADIDKTPWLHPLTDAKSSSPYKSRSKHLGQDFVDIEWEFIQADDEHPAVQKYIEKRAADPHTRLTVAVCVPDANQAVAIAVNMPPAVYSTAVQVLVYQREGDSIVRALSKGAISGFSPFTCIRPFGMSASCYDPDSIPVRDFQAADARLEASASKSAAANMWSNIYNSAHLWTKLRSIGSKDGSIPAECISLLGKTEHIRWNVEQLLTQFRPLTEAEQKAVMEGRTTKDQLKREHLAHLDICSRDRLEIIDPEAVPWDEQLLDLK